MKTGVKIKIKDIQKSKLRNNLIRIEDDYLNDNLTKKTSSACSLYSKEIRALPKLSKKELNLLAREYYYSRKPDLRERLIKSNLRFVLKIAYQFHKKFPHLPFEDLVQEGNKGLLYAVLHYNPEKNVSFAHYAFFWIKANIFTYVIPNFKIFKLSRPHITKRIFGKYLKAKDALENYIQDFSIEDNDWDKRFISKLTMMLNLTDKEVNQLLAYEKQVRTTYISLDESLYPEDDKLIKDIIPIDNVNDSEKEFFLKEENRLLKKLFYNFVGNLKDRDRFIFLHRYNYFDENFRPRTLSEIGKSLGITKERVRQKEKKLVEKFKQYLIRHGFEIN